MNDLNYIQLIFSAFIGAGIALILNSIYNYFKTKVELNRVKSIIISDLKRKAELMNKFSEECDELTTELNNIKEEDRGKYLDLDELESINRDIYDSQTKTDLFRVFGADNLIKINEIYDELIQLTGFKPTNLLENHNIELREHEDAKAGQPHMFLCGWHLKLIKHTCQGLKLEKNKSQKVKSKIEILLKKIK